MKIYLQVCAAFLFIACLLISYTSVQKHNPQTPTHNNTDSIVKDIPLYQQKASFKKKLKSYENTIGLSSLENGFDGTEIRIWNTNAISDTFQMVNITNTNSKWKVELYVVATLLNKKNDSLEVVGKTVFAKAPKSGWTIFSDSLFRLDIKTLPDYSKISGYEAPMDATGPMVEVANRNSYRIYSYPVPSYFGTKFLEAKKMNKIMHLIENEFAFKWLWL